MSKPGSDSGSNSGSGAARDPWVDSRSDLGSHSGAGHDAELEALGDRLAAAARAMLSASGCRTAKQLAERVKADGTTARRVIRMVAENARGSVVLTRSPSHAHLQRLANQARTQGIDASACDALHEAAGAFAALLKDRGMSRATLTKLIRDDREGLPGDAGDGDDGGED